LYTCFNIDELQFDKWNQNRFRRTPLEPKKHQIAFTRLSGVVCWRFHFMFCL